MKITFEQLPNKIGEVLEKLDSIHLLLLHKTTNDPGEEERPLDIKAAAEFLNLAVPTIYTLVSQKVIPYSKKGKKLYFKKLELSDWINSGRKKTISEIEAEVIQILASKKAKG